MAIPALRATILLTTATAAAGTLLYEKHEPFREWADDVGGRAQAAWVGIKEELRELKDDIEGHAQRRREPPMGARSDQWEGVNGENRGRGPWRRRRRSSGTDRGRGVDAATASANDVESKAGPELRKRRGSVHEGQMTPTQTSVAATEVEKILSIDANEAAHVTHEDDRDLSTSRMSFVSARDDTVEDMISNNDSEPVLTPTSTIAPEDESIASMSVISAPSEADAPSEDLGVLTPTSGMMTPTSSHAEEFPRYEELRRELERQEEAMSDGRNETAGSEVDVDDVKSESGMSEWSSVSKDVA